MSHSIHKLDDTLINKIAAGEVIERPSSVVKELIENSLDAGSKIIQIRIKAGGKKLLQVVDDGCGIHRDQLELAISRHTTSKIKTFDDLFRLQTKGFRGEALASICSVAQTHVVSKVDDQEAAEIIVDGGRLIDQRAAAHQQGTTVTVKHLFHQTPARLKFLKTDETETAHIVTVVTKMALSHPHVGFELTQNQTTLFGVPQGQTLLQRICAVFGKDLSEYMYPFSGELAGMQLEGFMGHPQIAKNQRNLCHLFVNQRSVTDKVLWHAIMESYRDVLMRGKFPVMVLNLSLDENLLDVNVHPTKSEVRFHHSSQIHLFVYQTLRNALLQAPWLRETTANAQNTFVNFHSPEGKNQERKGLPHFYHLNFSDKRDEVSPVVPRQSVRDWNVRPQKQIGFSHTAYAEMNPIGQLLGTYILCESGSQLVLIDQHAAHERIGYEKLNLQYQKDEITSERLLLPETFDLMPSDAEILKNYLGELMRFGFEIEFFGGNTFVVKAEPTLLKGKIRLTHLISDLLEEIKQTGELVSLQDKWDHILATMACHAQIRAHHHLSLEEIRSLLRELDEYQLTDFCPHGRPVCVEVSLEEIEKWFKRTL